MVYFHRVQYGVHSLSIYFGLAHRQWNPFSLNNAVDRVRSSQPRWFRYVNHEVPGGGGGGTAGSGEFLMKG